MLDDLLARRILVLDGAMGTLIPESGNRDALSLTNPDAVSRLHEAYLAAGADIIKTNTFRANATAQAEYGFERRVHALNVRAAELARTAAAEWSRRTPDKPRFVAGAVGPIRPDASAETPAYREQVRALIDGGVDLLLLETVVHAPSVGAALTAIADEFAARGGAWPVMVSASLTRDGRLLSGETVEEFHGAIQWARPFSVGLNCSFGTQHLRPFLERLARVATSHVTCHPNAGLPDDAGHYAEEPLGMANALREFAESGLVDIVGGCCGTTPAHIRALDTAVRHVRPRLVHTPKPQIRSVKLDIGS